MATSAGRWFQGMVLWTLGFAIVIDDPQRPQFTKGEEFLRVDRHKPSKPHSPKRKEFEIVKLLWVATSSTFFSLAIVRAWAQAHS